MEEKGISDDATKLKLQIENMKDEHQLDLLQTGKQNVPFFDQFSARASSYRFDDRQTTTKTVETSSVNRFDYTLTRLRDILEKLAKKLGNVSRFITLLIFQLPDKTDVAILVAQFVPGSEVKPANLLEPL